MAMGTRRKRRRQHGLWISAADLPTTAAHPFYRRVNAMLDAQAFDEFVERTCRSFYAETMGRPSLTPGMYFRLLLVGYFEAGRFRYAGKVGTGFSAATLKDLRGRLDALERERSPFADEVREPAAHWVEPEQCELNVVQKCLLREQRQDLIGAGETKMYASFGRYAHQFMPEELHRSGICGEIAGDEIEQRGLAGAVRTDD